MPFRCMHTLCWAAFPTLGCGVGVVSQPISVTISTAAVIRACAWGGLLHSNRCLNSSIKNSVAALCKINKPRAHSTAAVIRACACPTTPRQWAETKKTKPRAEHGCRLVSIIWDVYVSQRNFHAQPKVTSSNLEKTSGKFNSRQRRRTYLLHARDSRSRTCRLLQGTRDNRASE